MTDGEWSAWPAPAKLNLFLQIVGQRADGYHRLQTVFQLLEWGDLVHLRVRPDGKICRVGGDTLGIAEADDLLVRAARLLQAVSRNAFGADLYADKRIPTGGGFGGGSSDAATVLVALNRLWRTGLSQDELADLGLRLGADVPLFVHGKSAWAEGVGEVLTPIDLPDGWFLLVDPGIGVATRELFQVPELTRDAAPATIADFVSGTASGNAFEPILRRLQPAVETVLTVLSQFGRACLTGTGSGCFVKFSSQAEAIAAQASLPGHLRSWVVAGASRSPLLRALAEYPDSN